MRPLWTALSERGQDAFHRFGLDVPLNAAVRDVAGRGSGDHDEVDFREVEDHLGALSPSGDAVKSAEGVAPPLRTKTRFKLLTDLDGLHPLLRNNLPGVDVPVLEIPGVPDEPYSVA